MPYVQGDVTLDDDKHANVTAAIRALLQKNPKRLTVLKLDNKGNIIGTHAVWLPNNFHVDLKAHGLWPIVQELDQTEESMNVYLQPVVILQASQRQTGWSVLLTKADLSC